MKLKQDAQGTSAIGIVGVPGDRRRKDSFIMHPIFLPSIFLPHACIQPIKKRQEN